MPVEPNPQPVTHAAAPTVTSGHPDARSDRGAAGRKYTDEALLEVLRRFGREHDGRPPTTYDWADLAPHVPARSTYARRFGSWHGALAAAGYAVPLPEHPLRKYARGLARREDGRIVGRETIEQVERRLYRESVA